MNNEINYLVRCISQLQNEAMEAQTSAVILDIIERRENLIQALLRLCKVNLKVGKVYTHKKFRDVVFQVTDIAPDGLHVRWWHAKDFTRMLGTDKLNLGDWVKGVKEVNFEQW